MQCVCCVFIRHPDVYTTANWMCSMKKSSGSGHQAEMNTQHLSGARIGWDCRFFLLSGQNECWSLSMVRWPPGSFRNHHKQSAQQRNSSHVRWLADHDHSPRWLTLFHHLRPSQLINLATSAPQVKMEGKPSSAWHETFMTGPGMRGRPR